MVVLLGKYVSEKIQHDKKKKIINYENAFFKNL